MKITVTKDEFKTRNEMVVAFDISKETLDFYGMSLNEQFCVTGEIKNRTDHIESQLDELDEFAAHTASGDLLVVCEPTGGLEQKLLSTARRQGLKTRFVSAESVKKMKVVIKNDTGKTDAIDSSVIHEVAKKHKTLEIIERGGDYGTLNMLHSMFEDESERGANLKNRVHGLIAKLFCDYSKNAKFTFNSSGLALMDLYGFNPYEIVSVGYDEFFKQMKSYNRYFKKTTIKDLWDDATLSVMHEQPTEMTDAMADQMRHYYQEYTAIDARKAQLEAQMITVYNRLEEAEQLASFTDINTFSKARIVAETGPLKAFTNYKKLIRLAGLNIVEKSSGKYEGQNKISKKGRAPLRKVLYQIIFTAIRKNGLYHDYYNSKKTHSSGNKIMVACMRNLLRVFLGIYMSGNQYDRNRVFTSEAAYEQLDPAC